MKSTKPITCSISVLVAGLISSAPVAAVMNGRVANSVDSSHTILIKPAGAIRNCSAVVVNRNLIFTAAHCFEEVPDKRVKIAITNRLGGTKFVTVTGLWEARESTKISEMKDVAADFAYIKTKEDLFEKLQLKESNTPSVILNEIQLNTLMNEAKGESVAYGYGVYNSRGDEGEKREVQHGLELSSHFKILRARSNEQGVGICEGDSGGGAFIKVGTKLYLVGILSAKTASVACGDSEMRGFYTRVDRHACWAQRKSKIKLGLTCN